MFIALLMSAHGGSIFRVHSTMTIFFSLLLAWAAFVVLHLSCAPARSAKKDLQRFDESLHISGMGHTCHLEGLELAVSYFSKPPFLFTFKRKMILPLRIFLLHGIMFQVGCYIS